MIATSAARTVPRHADRAPCLGLAFCFALTGLTAAASAQDVIYLKGGDLKSAGGVKVTGEILDYGGGGLSVALDAGKKADYPLARVVRIETARNKDHLLAEPLLARGQYADALARYSAALKLEPRVWMRREILARITACYRGQGQWGLAGETFLALVQSDPETPFFPVIPLVWSSQLRGAANEPRAVQWFNRADEPVASLLGASQLLISHREPALARLKVLAGHDDPRIAWLASTQLWRATAATATLDDLERWRQRIEEMPEQLRGGPYYVLGRAFAVKRKPQTAALLLMRTPVLYASDRGLAARALVEAGEQCMADNDPVGAGRLWREVLGDYPQEEAAAEATKRFEQWSAEKGRPKNPAEETPPDAAKPAPK